MKIKLYKVGASIFSKDVILALLVLNISLEKSHYLQFIYMFFAYFRV